MSRVTNDINEARRAIFRANESLKIQTADKKALLEKTKKKKSSIVWISLVVISVMVVIFLVFRDSKNPLGNSPSIAKPDVENKSNDKVAIPDKAWLGVEYQEMTSELAKSSGIKTAQGVKVVGVILDSPAAQAGIQINDIIIEFNGQQINNDGENFLDMIQASPINGKATLKIIRQGKSKTVDFKVGLRPNQYKIEIKPNVELTTTK